MEDTYAFKCCVSSHNCPKVEIKDRILTIKDDFGGTVKVTKDQFEIMIEEYLEYKHNYDTI